MQKLILIPFNDQSAGKVDVIAGLLNGLLKDGTPPRVICSNEVAATKVAQMLALRLHGVAKDDFKKTGALTAVNSTAQNSEAVYRTIEPEIKKQPTIIVIDQKVGSPFLSFYSHKLKLETPIVYDYKSPFMVIDCSTNTVIPVTALVTQPAN